ncbi:YjbQ family protein [bacterium]|nr:YjbQ family protein [bacterium]
MFKEFSLSTRSRTEFISIDHFLEEVVRSSGVRNGVCYIFVPHTTAAVTINENADPNVVRDILAKTEELIPANDRYRHMEGNADAHIKASFLGASEVVFIRDGRLMLGTWQSVFFCEFDGPRSRRVWIQVLKNE